MQYFKVYELNGGGYHFACAWRDEIRPVGYCGAWHDWDETTRTMSPAAYQRHVEDKPLHHAEGHATPEEAAACYRRYLLDHRLQLNHKESGAQRKCQVCGEWTQLFVMVDGHWTWHLCETHHNRETVETLLESELTADTEIWSS